jgi:CRP/FNR family transcriptional regulator, cyclic AMP receptor protein
VAAINPRVSERVSVLDADAGMAELVPADERTRAAAATAASVLSVAPGSWRPGIDSTPLQGGHGLLAVDGVLLRRVEVGGRHAAELLGPGDLLRPWQHDPTLATLQLEWTWRVVEPTRFAVLDADWAGRAAAWPQLGAELTGRALSRALRLVITMAIAQQPRLDVRLLMLFWELADRYGIVKPDGVHLPLPLTHELLSHLAGARRPSVSASLTRLAREGLLFRSGHDWVLTGDPPDATSAAA